MAMLIYHTNQDKRACLATTKNAYQIDIQNRKRRCVYVCFRFNYMAGGEYEQDYQKVDGGKTVTYPQQRGNMIATVYMENEAPCSEGPPCTSTVGRSVIRSAKKTTKAAAKKTAKKSAKKPGRAKAMKK